MRVHITWRKRNGDIAPSAFKNHGAGMSTDWAKYATPEATRNRHREPAKNAVVSLVAGEVRRIPGQAVEHSPLPENRAYTDVLGEKDEEVRLLLRRAATLIIRFEFAELPK
jgi:hypothetical protein